MGPPDRAASQARRASSSSFSGGRRLKVGPQATPIQTPQAMALRKFIASPPGTEEEDATERGGSTCARQPPQSFRRVRTCASVIGKSSQPTQAASGTGQRVVTL